VHLLHKQYIDAQAASQPRYPAGARAGRRLARPPSTVRRAVAIVLARSARAVEHETARRVVA